MRQKYSVLLRPPSSARSVGVKVTTPGPVTTGVSMCSGEVVSRYRQGTPHGTPICAMAPRTGPESLLWPLKLHLPAKNFACCHQNSRNRTVLPSVDSRTVDNVNDGAAVAKGRARIAARAFRHCTDHRFEFRFLKTHPHGVAVTSDPTEAHCTVWDPCSMATT